MSQQNTSGGTPQRGLVPIREKDVAGKDITVREGGAALEKLEDMHSIAKWFVAGGAAPKGDSPATVLAKIQAGAELGITPMWAVSNITMINGRAGIMGDLATALIRDRKSLRGGTDIDVEYFEDEGKTIYDTPKGYSCRVTAHRRYKKEPVSRTFSMGEAQDAKLFPPQDSRSPWKRYPQRMLYYRALGFLSRDLFSDVLKGLSVAEELRDMPGVQVTPGGAPALTDGDLSPEEAAAAGPDPLLAGAFAEDGPVVDVVSREAVEAGPSQPPDEEPIGEPVPEEKPEAEPDPEPVGEPVGEPADGSPDEPLEHASAMTCGGCGSPLAQEGGNVFCPECGLSGEDAVTGPPEPPGEAPEPEAPTSAERLEQIAASSPAFKDPEGEGLPAKPRRSRRASPDQKPLL